MSEPEPKIPKPWPQNLTNGELAYALETEHYTRSYDTLLREAHRRMAIAWLNNHIDDKTHES